VNLAAARAVVLLAAVAATASLAASTKSKNSLYGAIAYHQPSGSMGWATDRRTSREASMEALKQCGHEQCVVVASVTRNCAALARNPKKFAVQKGATRQEAETKALAKCGAGCEVAVWTCTL
jgi:hypothetical protein